MNLAIDFIATTVLPRIGVLDEIEVEFIPEETVDFRASASLLPTSGRCQIRISRGVLAAVAGLQRRVPASVRQDLRDAVALSFANRRRGTDVVAILCISFLLVHELAHAASGHIDFFQGTGRKSMLPDRPGETGPMDDFVRIRELEADGVAVSILYRLLPLLRAHVGKRASEYRRTQKISRREQKTVRQLLLFSALIGTFQFDEDRPKATKPTYSWFSRSRIVGVIIDFILTAKRGSVVFDDATRTISCKAGKLPGVLGYFRADVLPVLQWCQAAADAGGFEIGLTEPRGKRAAEPPIARDILAIIGGGAALSSSALAIHHLGPSLEMWYSQIQDYRKGKPR